MKIQLLSSTSVCRDLHIFRDAATQQNYTELLLEEYASTVTSFFSKCIDGEVNKKTLNSFSNHKGWMNQNNCPSVRWRGSISDCACVILSVNKTWWSVIRVPQGIQLVPTLFRPCPSNSLFTSLHSCAHHQSPTVHCAHPRLQTLAWRVFLCQVCQDLSSYG